MPAPGLSASLRILPLILLAALCPAPAGARSPNLSRYPLRVHVLAAGETHKTPRMNPAESLVCDSIEDMGSSISPNPGGPISLSGISGDPCSLHPEIVAGRVLDENGKPVRNTPETNTTIDQDSIESRVRVRPGFQSLPARWKKPGQRLEVLVPSDDIPVNGRPVPPAKCSFNVTLQSFVYLLLRNGKLIQVSQEDYWKRPVLRTLLSGGVPTVQQRLEQFTVPAHPAR